MVVAKSPLFTSFEAYLAADPSDLPEGYFEYWDGELRPAMTESIFNDEIANYLLILLINAGIPFRLIRPGKVEVVVPGRPKTRFPDFLVLEEVHLELLEKRATITPDMPPPRLIAEVVSPGSESSDNYQRDYQHKPQQYAAIAVPEYWIIDPDRNWVMVGVLTNEIYQFATFRGNETLVSSVFPSLNITAAQILRAGQ